MPSPTAVDLVEEVRAELEQGRSLAQLERTLLADGDAADEVAAAWLYAWAYGAMRPMIDRLAGRVPGDP